MAPSPDDAYKNPNLSHSLRARVEALADAIARDPNYKGPDTVAHREGNITLRYVSPGHTEFTMSIPESLCNKSGNLHGGMAATILDNLTSTALLTLAKPGFLDAGHVSRTITMSYLRPVPMGSEVEIICDVVSAGRNLANLKGEIRIGGKTAVTCIHDKAVFQKGFVHPNQRKQASRFEAKL
jgi:acyl-coenzyme A thioesterase 13